MNLENTRNLLLQGMSPEERDRLGAEFREERLDFKQTLAEQGKPVKYVYFIDSGVMSLVTDLSDGEVIETGTVGNEGLVGLPAVLGVRHSPGRALCQIPGHGFRVRAEVITAEAERGTPWFRLLLRYANFVVAMTAQGAACNRLHAVDARMSRWLLMTHDRVDGDDFPLTQEFLGLMIGAARPTVNIAGATLQKAGFIRYTRGRITVLDRTGLESAACECYFRIRDELEVTLNGAGARRGALRHRTG